LGPGFGFRNVIQNNEYDNQIDYDGIRLLDPVLLWNFTGIKGGTSLLADFVSGLTFCTMRVI
jgi:hypothetical protein